MQILFSTLELVSISLGAGAAMIFDTFFILSLKNHTITASESISLYRINLMAMIATTTAIVALNIKQALILENLSSVVDYQSFGDENYTVKMFLYTTIFIITLTIRRYHLKTLLRHQHSHSHLSNSFKLHQDSLISAVSFTSLGWIMIIFLMSLEQRYFIYEIDSGYHFTNSITLLFVISYILMGYIFAKINVYLKTRLLSTR